MLADAAPLARPHRLAIKFHLPDGTDTDLVTHSFNGFPTKSPENQRQLFLAVADGLITPPSRATVPWKSDSAILAPP
jgi:catalase